MALASLSCPVAGCPLAILIDGIDAAPRKRSSAQGNMLQEPVTLILKEYIPGARSVACNEMQALVHLAGGLPDRKWHAAIAPVSGELPIVPLLGEPLNWDSR